VQVKQTPSLVLVHSHLHMAILHWHITMPFIMQQQLHMPPAIILQRFCIITRDISSSHLQVIFMPPAHFSIFIVQRGTMAMPAGAPDMVPGIAMPGIEVPVVPSMPLSIIIMVIVETPFRVEFGLSLPRRRLRAEKKRQDP
jgi:hypothetical protein